MALRHLWSDLWFRHFYAPAEQHALMRVYAGAPAPGGAPRSPTRYRKRIAALHELHKA